MLPIKPVDAPLYAILVITNPARYRTRNHLYRNTVKYLEDAGAVVFTAEVATGDREFEVTTGDNSRHIQLRSSTELWHKENLINLAVQRLPADWKYVAWIDADVQFARPDIVSETVHQLQHFDVVQMFSHAIDLGPRFEPLRTFNGFMYQYVLSNGVVPEQMENYGVWHSGYAWACRRDAWDQLGGLIDFAIVGSADRYMACALIGEINQCLSADLVQDCPTYVAWLQDWQDRAETYVKRNVGFVEGLLYHHFHGRKALRQSYTRPKILTGNQFDPSRDVKRDWQGLWQLSGNKPMLRDQLRAYMKARDEDSTAL